MYADTPKTGNAFLDALPLRIIDKLRPELREVKLKVGEQVYQQDVIPPAVYFPVDAIISKYQMLEDGRSIEVALAGPESAVALAPTVALKGSLNYCEVLVAGTALKAPSPRFLKMVKADVQLGFAVMNYFELQLRQVSRRLLCNQYHTLEPRLGTWLLMVAERRNSMVIKVTHDQIARALGYFRPTVSLAIEALRREDLVKQSRGSITVLDRPGLAKCACDCFDELTLRTRATQSFSGRSSLPI